MDLLLLWLVLIGGRGADAPVREDPSGGRETAAAAPQLALAPDGSALLAWESHGGSPVVRFARRDAPGRWTEPRTLSGSPALEPRIAAGPAGRVLAVWLAPDPARGGAMRVETRASADGGRSWAEPVALPGGAASQPAVAVGEDGLLWTAWEDQGGDGAGPRGERDIRIAHSGDGGATWSAPRRVDADAPGAASSFHPSLVPDGDAVLVAWWDLRNGLDDVYVRRMARDPGGDGPETRLDVGDPGAVASHDVSAARTPAGAVRVRWREGYGEAPFFGRESRDGGRTWGPVTPDPGPPLAAGAVGPDGAVHTVRVRAAPGPLEYERTP